MYFVARLDGNIAKLSALPVTFFAPKLFCVLDIEK